MAPMPGPSDIVEVETTHVHCDGGGGALGHPKVYLTLVDGEVVCPYCDRKFVLKTGIMPVIGH